MEYPTLQICLRVMTYGDATEKHTQARYWNTKCQLILKYVPSRVNALLKYCISNHPFFRMKEEVIIKWANTRMTRNTSTRKAIRGETEKRDGSKCGAPAVRSGGGSILELQPTDCTADSKYTFPFTSALKHYSLNMTHIEWLIMEFEYFSVFDGWFKHKDEEQLNTLDFSLEHDILELIAPI